MILALGANPREIGLPEERNLWGRGVAYCATCDGMLYKDKDVAIVGGGNTAVEEALFLSKICKHVTLIHRRDKLAAQQVMLRTLLEAKNVTILYNSSVKAIHAEKKVTGITVANKDGSTQEIAVAGLFVAIGRVPVTQMFEGQLQLDKQGYIIADETTRTNLPGVFAVGDIRTKALRQIITAAADGAMASKFAEEYLNTL
jgi:thioredoxin reductase (NADPH)